MKLVIGMGLPASGKTTFLKEYEKNIKSKYKYGNRNPSIRYHDFDKKKEFRKSLGDYDIVIIDGLFLINDDVIRLISEISSATNYVPDKIEIHYWKPNIEYCLWNDKGRRDKDSTTTIKNALLAEPDAEYIVRKFNEIESENQKGYSDIYKQTFEIDIKIVKHDIVKKPMERMFIDKYNIYEEDGFLKSNSWCTGGSWGDCWGNSGSVSSSDPEEFYQLDNLLSEICPTISFLQYKKIHSNCVETDSYSDGDYYGGRTWYNFYKCDISKLYEQLNEMGLLNLLIK